MDISSIEFYLTRGTIWERGWWLAGLPLRHGNRTLAWQHGVLETEEPFKIIVPPVFSRFT
jgi:hypothetical protein